VFPLFFSFTVQTQRNISRYDYDKDIQDIVNGLAKATNGGP
jgi:hypothetical protein